MSNIGGFIAGPPRHVSKAAPAKNTLSKVGSQDNFNKNEEFVKTPNGPADKKLKSMYYADMIKNSYKTPAD